MPLTNREILRTFHICFDNKTGTAFLHYVENTGFFVTAAHTLAGAQIGDCVLFRCETGWRQMPITSIFFHPDGYDVCCFSKENLPPEKVPTPYKSSKTDFGGELKFLGFPHGLHNTYQANGYSTPLVRTAFFSGVISLKGKQILLLDGFNNPGYSGGPVYSFDERGHPSLLGIISGYRYESRVQSGIFKTDEDGNEIEVRDFYTKPNSGMIYATGLATIMAVVTQFLCEK